MRLEPSSQRTRRAAIYAAAILVGLPLVAVTCAEGTKESDPVVSQTTAGAGGGATTSTSSAVTSSSESAGGAGGQGGAPPECTEDADCADAPGKPRCNTADGTCVGCLPDVDPCPVGQYCHPDTLSCAVGCTDDEDCAPGGDLVCDTSNNACVGCVLDTECPLGSICEGDTCVPGCSPMQDCQDGYSCCGVVCKDLATDTQNCLSCGNTCTAPAHATTFCSIDGCGFTCDAGFSDCDLDGADGCEQNVLQDGDCVCTPGDTQACYSGDPGTEGTGACHGGTSTCTADGLGWSACIGQVLPETEICDDGIDQDCDGAPDDGDDADGDGWTTCDGDCCDDPADCADPVLVNPGAFEFVGNGINDDCDLATSDVSLPFPCSTIQKFATVTGNDIAKAMDLCQFTTQNPPQTLKKWGVISAQQLLASGSVPTPAQLANMQNWQSAVLVNYGVNVGPVKGSTMAGIMSGKLRDVGDAGYVQPNAGTDFATASVAPATYLNAHGGQLPASNGCSGSCVSGSGANDSVNVRLTIRVPTNAKSFSYQFKFYTAEYWGFSCSIYNDFFLALLQSTAPGIPVDTNISFDALGNPVSVNNGFFSVCQQKGCFTCPSGTNALIGTGMDQIVNSATYGDGMTGGGTNWLTTEAPVVPGETIVLELMVFDVTGHILDSLALLDNFAWSAVPANVETHE